MKFDWMQRVIDEVPADWQPELRGLTPDGTLLGPVPEDIMPAFRAGKYGEVLVQIVTDTHEREDHIDADDEELTLDDAKAMAAKCKEVHERVDMIRTRAAAIGVAALEAIRDAYSIPLTHEFAVVREGVVSRPKVNETDGIIELLTDLMGEGSPLGGRVRVLHG